MRTENNTIINILSLDEYADGLYCVSEELNDYRLKYYQIQAENVGADYFYCLDSELESHKIPFLYIYDYRNKQLSENELAVINRKIWTVGDIALAIIVYTDEIKIIDTRLPVKVSQYGETANLVFESVPKIDEKLKEYILNGRILERGEEDYLSFSPYVKLLEHVDKNIISKQSKIGCSTQLLRHLIVKCILIKYLEEQVDENKDNIFKNNFFSSYTNIPEENTTFCDVLRNGDIPRLFADLNNKFNGGVFNLSREEEEEIYSSNLNAIANALDGSFDPNGQGSFWKLYDLKLIPIEFISRLYERFILSVDGRQKKDGAYYTPPNLARLIIDEVLPFDKEIDFDTFRILDPSCGSGIFLVLAYKRLITLWMLKNKKSKIEGKEDIAALKRILSNCIYGVDINNDAISITATSLQIEYTSHFNPKDIDLIQFDHLILKGNLNIKGFFKWYKESRLQFDVIVGNPPFNIDKNENIVNAGKMLDDLCDQEFYLNEKNKIEYFPYKNPALTILYQSMDKLIKYDGFLFMIMPSSAFLYNPSSLKYRQVVFTKWSPKKIYDFTPLQDFLWGKTKVATIAVLIQKKENNQEPIEHIIVRSSYLNHKGAIRFQIDKYDRFHVPFERAQNDKYYWKTNLLGGGRLHFYINKYLSTLDSIENFVQNKDWIANVGYQRDASTKKHIINLKNQRIVISDKMKNDELTDDIYDTCENDDIVRISSDEELYKPTNIFIRLNVNYDIPILLNNKDAFFPKGILGIKGRELEVMEQFVYLFKQNRPLYKKLIGIISSKVFVQQSGQYTIDAQDILNLPLKVDLGGNPVEFEKISEMEKAVWEDTELMASCINKTTGTLFEAAKKMNLEQYAAAFCEIMNYIYENGEFKFRLKRLIINENWVWVTFCHTNLTDPFEVNLYDQNETLYNEILKDDISNNGLRINRVITYINEPNCISFLKPRALKYWTRSIGYRDAEEIKSIMFNNGY